MNDATTTDIQATDAERAAAHQVISIFREIDSSARVSIREHVRWLVAVNLATPHVRSQVFLDALSEGASGILENPGLALKLFLAHAVAAQFEERPK